MSQATPTDEDALALEVLGPETVTWKYAGDNLGFLLAGQALILQVAHPVVGAGVAEHSTYKTDPWGRLERTTKHVSNFIYGGPEVARRTAQHLREMHRPIKGTDVQGRRYTALDPEAYAWVHLTLFYAIRSARTLYADPLDADEEARFYAEWRTLGRLLGVREAQMPSDVRAFDAYIETMIASRLEDNEVVEHLLGPGIYDIPKPPFLRLLPNPIFRVLYYPVGMTVRIATVHALPESLRAKLGIPERKLEALAFAAFRRVVRFAVRPLPAFIRFTPESRKAYRDAGRVGRALFA